MKNLLKAFKLTLAFCVLFSVLYIFVLWCSTPWPFNIWFNQTRGVVKALREILKWSGFSIKGVIQKGGTKQHPELTENDKKKCRKIIRKL